MLTNVFVPKPIANDTVWKHCGTCKMRRPSILHNDRLYRCQHCTGVAGVYPCTEEKEGLLRFTEILSWPGEPEYPEEHEFCLEAEILYCGNCILDTWQIHQSDEYGVLTFCTKCDQDLGFEESELSKMIDAAL